MIAAMAREARRLTEDRLRSLDWMRCYLIGQDMPDQG
jgi:hypothetical protein